jgi:hypothetical protein
VIPPPVLSMECETHFLPRQGGNFCRTGTFCRPTALMTEEECAL